MKLSIVSTRAPGGGSPSTARNPLDGGAGPDFGAMLGGMAKDAPVAAKPAVVPGAPPTAEATRSAEASIPDARVPGEAEDQETGSQRKAFSSAEGETQLPDVPAITAPAVGGVAEASGVTGLLTLAARAAEPARHGAAQAPTAALGAEVSKPSDRAGRKASEADDDDRAQAAAGTMAPVPTAVAALLVATGALVSVTVPAAADTMPNAPTTDALPLSTGTALPVVDGAPASPALPANAAAPADVAIVPGTVSVESHLGFDRGTLLSVVADPGARTIDMRSSAPLGPIEAGARVELAGASPSHPAHSADANASRATDIAAPLGADRAAGPSPAPLAWDAAAPAAGAEPSLVASAPAAASSAGAAATDVTLAAQEQETADPTSAGPPSGSTVAMSADEAARSVSASTRPAKDEPNPPVADAPAMATPTAALAMPTPQAAGPIAQQVADGVAGLAASVIPDEAPSGTPVAPARTMALQLSPAGLGTLTVRLHVAGRALDVHLEASDGGTAALIERDRDALSGALRGRDYQLQTLSVTTHAATMPGGPHAERGTDPRSADAGSSDPGSPGQSRGGPSGERPGGGGAREAPERAARPRARPMDETVLERGGASLFV